jgi:hypothetical protein
MVYSKTLAAPVFFEGIGVHSGRPVSLRLLPFPGKSDHLSPDSISGRRDAPERGPSRIPELHGASRRPIFRPDR